VERGSKAKSSAVRWSLVRTLTIFDVTVTRIHHVILTSAVTSLSDYNDLSHVGEPALDKNLLPVCETMSLGTGASYYRPRPSASDPFQLAPGLYSSSDGHKFDVQSEMMYDDHRSSIGLMTGSSFSSATALAFDVRCSPSLNGYEYAQRRPFTGPATVARLSDAKYGIKTTGVAYGQGLARVHSQSTPVNHAVTPSQTALQHEFTVYPWMRSMTAGRTIYRYVCPQANTF